MRDGIAVTKTKLVPDENAQHVAAYLRTRAKGIAARQAAREAGLTLSPSSLVDLEWRALTYAGHTVWNQTNARMLGGGYVGSSKRRLRSDWQVQRDTHEPLITPEEAEAIVSRLEKKTTTRMRGDEYLLSGLLQWPEGKRWHGDQGFYRCGRRRLSAKRIEQQVIEALSRELTADGIIKQATKLAREGAAPGANEARVRALRRQLDELSRKIARVRNVMTVMAKPEAMAPSRLNSWIIGKRSNRDWLH